MDLKQNNAHTNLAAESEALPASSDTFPSVRYFQVHFEHIEGMMTELRLALERVKAELDEVRSHSGLSGYAPREMADDCRTTVCPCLMSCPRRQN